MPRPTPPTLSKKCVQCELIFTNKITPHRSGWWGAAYWAKTKFCNRACAFASRVREVQQKICQQCQRPFVNVFKRNGRTHADVSWDKRIYCGRACNSLAQRKLDILKSFRAKSSKDKNDIGCVEWIGRIGRTGYGMFYFRTASGKTMTLIAHRMAYAIAHGKTPKNQIVCHTCGNRKCVNSDHLYLGDHLSNAADRDGRARQSIKPIVGDHAFREIIVNADGSVWAF